MLAKLLISPALFFMICFSDSGRQPDWSPENKYIPYSIADQRLPSFKVSGRTYLSTSIYDSSSLRSQYSLGAIIPVAKYKRFQFNFGASFFSQTDMVEALDIIGWDGVMLTDVAYRFSENFGLRFSNKHVSGHLGDEYIERTNRERISYSRNENAFAIWFSPLENTSLLIESAFDFNYDYDNDYNYQGAPWRHQLGLFHINETPGEWHPYWAVDIQIHQEDDWSPNYSGQSGFSISNKEGERFRIGVEYYRGKVNLMEFSGDREEFISIGIWMDF